MKLRKIMTVIGLISGILFFSVKTEGKESPDTISARRAFLEMPTLVLDLLPQSTRLDMLDFFDADSVFYAHNEKDGLSQLTDLTSDYAKVELTGVSDLEIKILKDKKGNDIVMTIYTIGDNGGARDSEVRFYDSRMQELETKKYMEFPKLKDFFEIPKGSLTKMSEIEELIPFSTVEYTATPGSSEVTAILTIGDILNLEDLRLVQMFEKPYVKLIWDGNKIKYKK